jgi:hypothetical protein
MKKNLLGTIAVIAVSIIVIGATALALVPTDVKAAKNLNSSKSNVYGAGGGGDGGNGGNGGNVVGAGSANGGDSGTAVITVRHNCTGCQTGG